jgi:hypothetical protein
MDNVIFEDPSKQLPRLKRPLHVQPIEVTPNQNDPTHVEQQRCIPSRRLGASDLDFGVSGRSSGESSIPSFIVASRWPVQESDQK